MIVFNGEFISAETMEEEPFHGNAAQVIAKVRRMKDGDSFVINASEEVDAFNLSQRH